MINVIQMLCEEHDDLTKLLVILEHQIKIFDDGDIPDYHLMEKILLYTCYYPELYHHPKETLVYLKLRDRDPHTAHFIRDIELEHRILTRLTQLFTNAVRNARINPLLPHVMAIEYARQVVAFSRRHMEIEETELFPAAVKTLEPEDWAELNEIIDDAEDPLFGYTVQESYRKLHEEITSLARAA